MRVLRTERADQFCLLQRDGQHLRHRHRTHNFNVVTTAILLPFNRLLEKLAILTVPDSPSDTKQENTLLDERLLTTPSVAVGRAMLTGGDMAEICRTALLQAMSTTRVWNDAIADEVIRKEDAVDHYEDVLGTYLVKLSAKHLSVEDNRSVNTLLHTIGDFERVSDHAVNIIKRRRRSATRASNSAKKR